MRALTTAERRGLLLVVGLYLLGAAWDLVRVARFEWSPAAAPAAGGDSVAGPAGPASGDDPASDDGPASDGRPAVLPLDLNAASGRDLEALDGIGPVLATRIVEHRRVHGPFRSVEELAAVRGIGPRLMARLRPALRVTPPRR